MADHVDITLWIDRRWKDAIEKHLKDETLQEHLENVLDELCNQKVKLLSGETIMRKMVDFHVLCLWDVKRSLFH